MNLKKLCIFLIAVISVGGVASGVDFIRQIQLIEGRSVVYDLPIAGTSGESLSKPLEGDGAIFQLYAYRDDVYSPFTLADVGVGSLAHANVSLGSKLVDLNVLGIHLQVNLGGNGDGDSLPEMLDEKAVGVHLPEGQIRLISEDPYFPPRTRADRPFRFEFAVRKLATEEGETFMGPKQCRVERSYRLYDPVYHIPTSNGSGQGRYREAYLFRKNGDFVDPVVYQVLPGERPTKAMGDETFSAWVQVNAAGNEARIAHMTVQVWPVAEAVIDGIEEGKLYQALPSDTKVVLQDLYPDSVTYAQIYQGRAVEGRQGYIIPSTIVSHQTFAPQDGVLPLDGAQEAIGPDGWYTIEIVTVTPFHQRVPERLAWKSFRIDRTLEVRGQLSTAE